ncbi:hypothetical protein [Streptacidiphilus carbonis]|uniref:hypothetical protein n=1 Tax=Streptacidiphilus carbonis TaxID=105422 RepID=UPI00126A13E8|nr:hypothetical protein [Streptacidiphilus carbonis]
MSAIHSARRPEAAAAADASARVPIGRLAERVVTGSPRMSRVLRGVPQQRVEVAAFQSSI